MNQQKIGKFIAECRKKQNMTQMQLAEKLGITDRAVSKWETGRAMPDSSIMLQLCGELNITVNDLLSGEVITMNNYDENSKKLLLEMVKQKEEADKKLLSAEMVIGTLSVIILLSLTFIAAFLQMQEWLRITLIASGFVLGMAGVAYALRLEQIAGYYECSRCHHRYVPTYKSVFFAMHINRTRYMKCPECGKRTWQEKVLSKD